MDKAKEVELTRLMTAAEQVILGARFTKPGHSEVTNDCLDKLVRAMIALGYTFPES